MYSEWALSLFFVSPCLYERENFFSHHRNSKIRRSNFFSLKSESESCSWSCLTLCDPMDCTVNGILQARILEWVTFPFSRSSQPRDWIQVSPHCRWILYQLSHKGSPRILEWVAYPVSCESSWSRNQTWVSSLAGRFFINWTIRESVIFPLRLPTIFTSGGLRLPWCLRKGNQHGNQSHSSEYFLVGRQLQWWMGYTPKGNCRLAACFTEGSTHAFTHSSIWGEEFTLIVPEIPEQIYNCLN